MLHEYSAELSRCLVSVCESRGNVEHVQSGNVTLEHAWFAVRVRSNYEQTTAQGFEGRAIEHFLPVMGVPYANTRRRPLFAPLFPGYVFAKFNPFNRLPVLSTPGLFTSWVSEKCPPPSMISRFSRYRPL